MRVMFPQHHEYALIAQQVVAIATAEPTVAKMPTA